MTHNLGRVVERSANSWLTSQLLFFLRFIQLGSTVLTGFISIYFVYWHCLLHDAVPPGLIIVICTSSVAFLECYTTSAYTLSELTTHSTPNFKLLLKTTAVTSLVVSFGYYSLRHVPYIHTWCEGDNWFTPSIGEWGGDSEVEKHMCALTCTVIVSGAVSLAFTIFLPIFAAIELFIKGKAGSIIFIDNEACEDNLLPGPGFSEQKAKEAGNI